MNPLRRAVIDVGTNSVKVLVADVSRKEICPIHEESTQTRLGEGFYQSHRLQPGPMEKTVAAVVRFAAAARAQSAASVRVIATSAVRDAQNAAELLTGIKVACALNVEVISGEQEADWAFRGATTEPSLENNPLFIADVGGGSTQFIVGRGEHKRFFLSCPLGTVRLLEMLPHSDPPQREELTRCRDWVARFLEQELKPALAEPLRQEAQVSSAGERIVFLGTGGTASILGCMEAGLSHFDRQRLERTRLSRERLRARTEALWKLPLSERRFIVGLPANRADVILMGAVIYESVACTFNFTELRISTRGLRFAALLDF